MQKIILFLLVFISLHTYGQTAKIWKVDKVNTPNNIEVNETQILIYIETSKEVFNYPVIEVIDLSSKEIIYSTHLTYYQHPGNDAEYLLIIPNALIKSKNYEIRLSRSLLKLGEILDFYLADKKTKRKLKKVSR